MSQVVLMIDSWHVEELVGMLRMVLLLPVEPWY